MFKVYIDDLAPWILRQEIKHIRSHNVELPVGSFESDHVFNIALANDKELLLHLEFEAHDSAEVMAFRMLEYRSRLAYTYKKEVLSAVFYIARAGRGDTGKHQLGEDASLLRWHYEVFRLEEISSQELLASDELALIALMGLSKLNKTSDMLLGLDKLRQETDNEKKRTLLNAFLSLIPNMEIYKMIEEALEKDDFFMTLDTPYIRKVKAIGREEGHEEMARADILAVLVARFKLDQESQNIVKTSLETLEDEKA
ncbi:MAG: hypothetical protein R2865_17405 [Deinococcales bacterium]